MAVESICAKLVNGLDLSCVSPPRKYYQQAVIINKSDIDSFTITPPDAETETCNYKVEFTLKEGATGYRIQGIEAGSSFFGNFDKSRSDLGYPQYLHRVQVLIAGITEAAKCILDALDKGTFVAVLQLTDGTVEVYGIENGLSSADYTYDVQANSGGSVVALQSLETAPETYIPLVYESATPGNETIDFDDAFANPASA